MYGAILGDIMSWWHKYENDGIFYLLDKEFKFSDYTVMTIAIADALLPIEEDEESFIIKDDVTQALIAWGKEYTSADANQHFRKWLNQNEAIPIDGLDNSAAAIISVIPYIYNDSSQVVRLAKWVAEVIHADTQSVDNAGFAALAIYYAKMCPRAVFKNNLESSFACDFDDPNDLTNIVFEAIRDFLDSTDLESAINNAIARGGDIKTRAVIAGSIAEAFYGISGANKSWCNSNLTEEMLKVLDKFDQTARRTFINSSDSEYVDNTFENSKLEEAMSEFYTEDTEENFSNVMTLIYYRMHEGGQFHIPMIMKDRIKSYSKSVTSGNDYDYLKLEAADGKKFIAVFTSVDENIEEKFPDLFLTTMKAFFKDFSDEDDEADGIILNPHIKEHGFILTKELMSDLLNKETPKNGMWYFSGNMDELKIEAKVISDIENFEQSAFEDDNLLAAAHFMTKAENGNQYIIHTPLLNYRSTNKDVIFNCYWYCLELARKYHIHSIAFPAQFSTAGNIQTCDGRNMIYIDLYIVLNSWFKENKDYGMSVIAVTGDGSETTGKGQFFKADFIDDGMSFDDYDDKSADKTDGLNDKINSFDYSRGKVVKTSEEAKQKVREFEKRFSSKEDFYQALREFGFKWRGENSSDAKIVDMWARNALARAIDEGFDPFKPDNFNKTVQDSVQGESEDLLGNQQIEKAIDIYHAEPSEENIFKVLKAIQNRMYDAGNFLTLMETEVEYPCHELEYDVLEENEKSFITAFTSSKESFDKENNKPAFTCKTKIKEIVKLVADNIFDGVVINRYGKEFLLTSKLVKKIFKLPQPDSEIHVYIGNITDLKIEAIANYVDKNLNGIDSKIDAEIHEAAGYQLSQMLHFEHCDINKAIITEGYELQAEYVIHTVVNDDMSNLGTCYLNCLKLSREYHINDIAIPITCSERSNIQYRLNILKDVFITANKVIGNWLKKNKDYFMRVTLVVEYEDQRFFKINEIIVENEIDS